MHAQLETLDRLERRLHFSVPQADIQQAVDDRLKRIARTAKISGFRPGKAPLKIVAQHYGHTVQEEAFQEVVQRSFATAVREQQLHIAGTPQFEAKSSERADEVSFSALFEVFPEVKPVDLSKLDIEKPTLTISEQEVDKTIEVLRKQRVRYEAVKRKAKKQDRVTLDFKGEIDGVVFAGGAAEDYTFEIGSGQMLPAFDEAIAGMKTAEEKVFPLTFPDDYHHKQLAGKTAQFTVTVKEVSAPTLPAVDGEFAKSLGIADGDMDKMRTEIQQNIEREVKHRLRSRTVKQVMDALLQAIPLDLPAALVASELQAVIKSAFESLKSRGIDPNNAPLPPNINEMLQEQAKQRAHLSLVLGELIRQQKIEAKPEQVKAMAEELAQSYENPDEMVAWYYASQERLTSLKKRVLEDNIINYVLSEAHVVEKPVTFDSLMETSA